MTPRKLDVGVTCLLVCLLVCLLGPDQGLADEPALSARDLALIGEVFHLQAELGHEVWPGWSPGEAPFLYKTPEWDFLLHHPRPPADFEPLTGEGEAEIWVRPNTDPGDYRAARRIGERHAAILTAPRETTDPHQWVLQAVHELFHVYQYQVHPERIVEPFRGSHAGETEISYPFPYDDPAVRSLIRLEAELVFTALTDPEPTDSDLRTARRVLGHAQTVAERIFRDPRDLQYKRWMEWNEGVARYTERELAALAADPESYRPTEAFAELHPGAGYTRVLEESFPLALNPIRFVGEGVRGNVQFYYLGMGKAYLLDRLDPGWRQRYFDRPLDGLLAEDGAGR